MINTNQAGEQTNEELFRDDESDEALLVQEWDSDVFHRKVAALQEQGYTFDENSYKVVAETNPESGEITHLHRIEMRKPDA